VPGVIGGWCEKSALRDVCGGGTAPSTATAAFTRRIYIEEFRHNSIGGEKGMAQRPFKIFVHDLPLKRSFAQHADEVQAGGMG
jgi:hypothetical protein